MAPELHFSDLEPEEIDRFSNWFEHMQDSGRARLIYGGSSRILNPNDPTDKSRYLASHELYLVDGIPFVIQQGEVDGEVRSTTVIMGEAVAREIVEHTIFPAEKLRTGLEGSQKSIEGGIMQQDQLPPVL